jgi:GNAT superfamily N-acetyltransferase
VTVSIEQVPWDDPRGVALRAAMDAEIGPRYADRVAAATPDERAARSRAFRIDPAMMVGVHLALDEDGTPIGHAALRRLDLGEGVTWELKRVVTLAAARGRGVGTLLIAAVEADAVEHGADRLVLQTGDRQPEAIALYEKLGYRPIPAYPPYIGALPEGRYFARAVG